MTISTYTVAALLAAVALILTVALVIDPSNPTYSSSLISVFGLLGILFAADQGPISNKNANLEKTLETANILHSLALSSKTPSDSTDDL